MKVESAEFVRSAHQGDGFVRDGRPEIAFVGRSNVGKSSLLNRLLGKKGLARVSSTPGRTQSVNYFLVNRRFWFVDLPGYGYAKAGKESRRQWGELVGLYFGSSRPLVVLLVDGFVGVTPLDVQAYGYLNSLEVPVVVTPTKIDRVPRGKRGAAVRGIRESLGLDESIPVIPVSAHSGEGMKDLWGAVASQLEASAR